AGGLSLGSTGDNGQAYLAQIQREISSVSADLAGADARTGLLASRLGEARSQLRAVPEQRVEIDRLERQRDATAARLRQLQTEADQVALTETTEVGFAQVIRDVQVPREEAGPGLPINVGVGSLLGFLLGLGVAFVKHQTDNRVRTPDDLRDSGFAVIGTVPDFSKQLRGERQEIEGASVHPGLVSLLDPFGIEAEAFRHLHAGLYSGTPTPQVVLVGAPEASAGKSLVAANVAIVAAQAGRRTLLIDADLRRPVVGELFGLGDHPLGEGPEGSNFVYWSTAAPGLFAMTPLEAAVRPDQMWAPDQIGALLDNLRDAFDLVVLDTPAALASANAALLAPHVDAAVLIAEADRTNLEAMTQVATELSGVGLARIGAVVNKFDARGAVGFGSTAAVRHNPLPNA
ncbi:hypothetical protein, partial [Rubrivirga sp.]|uniref:nucleotide-binding protein n=1 Tax=Rubrivirga sp. TaxID=1885344 RepID=UPI003C77CD7E